MIDPVLRWSAQLFLSSEIEHVEDGILTLTMQIHAFPQYSLRLHWAHTGNGSMSFNVQELSQVAPWKYVLCKLAIIDVLSDFPEAFPGS